MKHKTFMILLTVILVFSSFAASPLSNENSSTFTCTSYHTVKKGEYLVKIAKLYGVSWRWLANINSLANPSRIFPGQKLCVKTDVSTSCATYYTVQRGDFLVKIGRKYGVTWSWLATVNNLVNPNRIFPGQQLCVKLN